jgi:ribosomal protein L37AE/L43A
MCDDLIEVGINIRIARYKCCPDCGHTEGLIFDRGYAGIIECCGCYSSFFPTASTTALVNVIRYRKGIRVSSHVSTSFGKFIDLADNFKDTLTKLRDYEDLI